MNTIAVVELEEGALTLTTAVCRGRHVADTWTVHVPLADQEPATIAAALAAARGDRLPARACVRVVLGDRRIQHHRCDVPRLPAADLAELVRREAMRITATTNAADVLIAAGAVRRRRDGSLRVGFAALPRSAWEPVDRLLREAGLEVAGVHAMENCLAAVAPASGRCAVVESGAGRTRFVLCEDGNVLQVRRFIVGAGSAGDGEAAGAQLSLELPRTIDWLRESGIGEPAAMVLGPRARGALQAARADLDGLPPVIAREHQLPGATGAPQPTLATSGLLRGLLAGRAPASLLDPLRLVLPITLPHFAALAAAAATIGLALWCGSREFDRWRAAERQVVELAAMRDEIDASLRELRADAAEAGEADAANEGQLRRALGRRRPLSLLLGDLARSAGGVRLDAIDVGADDRILVSGFVAGNTRREALDQVARFLRSARSLPYVRTGAAEDIDELQGLLHGFRFRIELAWRNG